MHFEPTRAMRDLDRITSQLLSGTRVPLSMPMDVWREGDVYHVALDLPGVQPDSIDINVERNTLSVTARRESSFGQSQGDGGDGGGAGAASDDRPQVVVAERPQGRFSRQLVLGQSLDVDAVQADYSAGVLHLTIPVRQEAKPRRVQISQSDQGGGQPRLMRGESRQEGRSTSTSAETGSISGETQSASSQGRPTRV